MKAKNISFIASLLCLCAFTGIAYAEDDLSAQGYNNRPQLPSHDYNSRPQLPSKGEHHRDKPSLSPPEHPRVDHRQKEERKGISISVNFGNPNYQAMNRNDRPFMPPHMSPPPPRHHRQRGFDWVNMMPSTPIPQDAVTGGFEHRRPLYVCRANYRGSMHPGKALAGRCHISWGGNEVILSHYQILTSYYRLNWVPVSYGNIPANAIPGGHENGVPLYICQAEYQGGLHAGKVIEQACNIGWGGKEVSIPYYNVLVG